MNKKWILLSSLLMPACGIVAIEQDNTTWTEEDSAIYTVLVSMHKANQFSDAQAVKILQKHLNQENFIPILHKRANILQKEVIDGPSFSMKNIKNISIEDMKQWIQSNYMSIVKPLLFQAAMVGLFVGSFKVDDMNVQWRNRIIDQCATGTFFLSLVTGVVFPCYKILLPASVSMYKYCAYDWSRTRELKMISEMIAQLQQLQ